MRHVAAAFFLLMLAGCSKPSPPPAAAKAVVGQWLVVSFNGKPLPEGTSVIIDYRPDGRLVVEKTGGDGTVTLPDESKLRSAMDAMNLPGFGIIDLKLRAEDFEIELKRKPGTSFTVP